MGGTGLIERDDSHDLKALRERLSAVRESLARLPISNRPDVGPTDPATGESWHRGNMLGHMSEMLGYWRNQIRRAHEGSGSVGRDEAGAQLRRRGIDRGEPDREADLKAAVDVEINLMLQEMDAWSPADLERKVVFHNRDGHRDARIGELVQMLVVAHLEEHVAQLSSVG